MTFKIEIKNNKIYAPLSKSKDKWLVLKPEEEVRQKYIYRLVENYGYELNQMIQEIQVNNSQRGQGRAMADIVVNDFYDSKNIRDGLWKKVLKKAYVKYRTIYQTRHTFCSINLQNGEDLIWVSRILGHKNPRITLEKYSKYIPTNSNKGTIFDNLTSY
jgi:integrase